MMKLVEHFENAIRSWLDRRREGRLLDRFGGIQTCPWCRQTVQAHAGWKFECNEVDRRLDRLTCGNCGGTSLWLWAMGMMFVGPLDPPRPAALHTATGRKVDYV